MKYFEDVKLAENELAIVEEIVNCINNEGKLHDKYEPKLLGAAMLIKMYNPESKIESQNELLAEFDTLIEAISKKVHDKWASQRINDGWVFGGKRDDQLKTHPCLVPYSLLPESEKEYDRATARETIAILLSCGYKIEKQ